MVFPLHHCDAPGCLELVRPGQLMCRRHWRLVDDFTVVLLLVADTPKERALAEGLARADVILAERRPCVFPADPDYGHDEDHPLSPPPDASQEETEQPSPPVPGDAGNREESHEHIHA